MPPSLTFSFRGETLASRPFRELAKIQRAEGGERILLKLDENESELSLPGGLGIYISTASIRFAKLAGSIFVESEDPIRVEEDGGRSFTFEGRRGFRTRFSIVRGGFRISVSDFFYLNPVEVLSLGNGESQPLVEVSGDGSIGGGEASVTIHTDKGEFRSVKRMDGSSICIQSDQIGRGEEIPVKVDVQLDATLSEIDRDAESLDSKADGRTVYSVGFNVKATDSARVIKDILLDFIPRWVKTIEGDDLVASGVQMEAESVEDDGKGICFNVYVYNVQPEITIDYSTGDNWFSGSEDSGNEDTEEGSGSGTQAAEEQTYILNTNTHKFHNPDCSGAKDIKEKNREEYTGTREELLSEGYEPCGRCKP